MSYMARKLSIFVFVACLSLNIAYANLNKFLKIDDLDNQNIQELIEIADSSTTVFIKLEDVITRPRYNMFSRNDNDYIDFVNTIYIKSKQSEFYRNRLENWMIQHKITLVEEKWPRIIKAFREKGAIVVGVSQEFVYLKDYEKIKFKKLQRFGLDLTSEILGKKVIKFSEENDWMCFFYLGVIFTGYLGHMDAIEQFMEKTHNVPKKMIYFSNDEHQIDFVYEKMRRFYMKKYFVQYNGIDEFRPPIDANKIRHQQQYFIEHGVILDDNIELPDANSSKQR